MTDIVSPIAARVRVPGTGKLNVLTCVVLVWFHIQAVAAFFTFSWTNLFAAVVLYWVVGGSASAWDYHRLHTHRGFKTYKAVRVFPGGLRHADARGRADLLGRHPSAASSALRPAGGSAHAARQRVLGAHGLDHLRRGRAQRHGADGALCARPRARIRSTAG